MLPIGLAPMLRFLAAAKIYELGRISSGKAAQMAGLPRVEFLTKLGQYGICSLPAEESAVG